MEKNHYKAILEKSPVGYAYHKIILDSKGFAKDYEFIEVNDAFEIFSGLKANNIIGKKATEVISSIKKSEFDWIGYYGNIALNGGSGEFKLYSESSKQWYRINTFSPEKLFFISFFSKISKEMEMLYELNIFSKLNTDFLAVMDEFGYFIKVNESWSNVLGYSIKDLEGIKLFDLLYYEDVEFTAKGVKKLNKDKKIVKLCNRLKKKNDEFLYMEWWIIKQNKLIYAYSRDCTHRISLEELLREKNSLFYSVISNINTGYALYMIDGSGRKKSDYSIKEINPAGSDIIANINDPLGYVDDEVFVSNLLDNISVLMFSVKVIKGDKTFIIEMKLLRAYRNSLVLLFNEVTNMESKTGT